MVIGHWSVVIGNVIVAGGDAVNVDITLPLYHYVSVWSPSPSPFVSRGVPPIPQIPQMRYGWRRRAQGGPLGQKKNGKSPRGPKAREGLWTTIDSILPA